MKTTRYFEFVRQRTDRVGIKEEWIVRTINEPVKEITQRDGRIRKWCKIDEASGRFLRVVLLADGQTVHNAFFDRNFKGA